MVKALSANWALDSCAATCWSPDDREVFVGVDVGDAVRAEASRVIQAISGRIEAVEVPPKVTWVKPEALHVTLRFIGEVDEAMLPDLCARLAAPFRFRV